MQKDTLIVFVTERGRRVIGTGTGIAADSNRYQIHHDFMQSWLQQLRRTVLGTLMTKLFLSLVPGSTYYVEYTEIHIYWYLFTIAKSTSSCGKHDVIYR